MLDINKQAMKYALQGQTVTVYEKDEDGNLKFYETEDGEKIYYTHEETGFSEPVDFWAIYRLTEEKRRTRNMALIRLILMLFC